MLNVETKGRCKLWGRMVSRAPVVYRRAWKTKWHWATLLSIALFLLLPCLQATIIDRIAAVVNSQPVKDSDIDRDIRLTDFMNQEALSFNEAKRKEAAQRLIEQRIIRREVQLGNYSRATPEQTGKFLDSLKQQRFGGNESRFRESLRKYGITEDELQSQLAWQLTVLNFIEERFRPAVLVPDTDIENYARAHPGIARAQIQEQLAAERVNQQYDSWMQSALKRAHVEYLEAGLK
jgi:hypothetical protein